LAVSGLSIFVVSDDLNDRYCEKRTFGYLTENFFNPLAGERPV